jgi:hypothetical protein
VIPSIGGAPFALLPAGPQASTRRRLWGDDAAGKVIEELRASFEYVVIDTPPLNEATDGAVAAALGDGAIVLARIGHTTTKGLRSAIQVLEAARAESIGTVVTCEPGHKRELSKQPVEAPAAVVAPREKEAPASAAPTPAAPAQAAPAREKSAAAPAVPAPAVPAEDATAQTGVIGADTTTEAINQAGAHRLSGLNRDGR